MTNRKLRLGSTAQKPEPGSDQFTVWNVNSSGAYVSNVFDAVAGNSSALESIEATFNQDLNKDGQIDAYVIQTDGSTSLSEIANQYFVNSGSGSIALQYDGASVTAGEFGGWVPIGAVKTASGYDIAWGTSGRDAGILKKFCRFLKRMDQNDQGVLLSLARRMAKQKGA